MALPVVAVIGRPNVGKSTLVNRLCRSREAIVHDEPGVTRDRTYQEGFWGDRTFKVVDTGGLVFDDDSEFLPEIREQANLALAEAVVAVVIVDGQAGVTAADESIAEWLRGQNRPVLLAVNKCESPDQGLAMAAEFWGLGLGEPFPISAIHGAGTGDLLDKVIEFLPPTDAEETEEPIQLAIIGRPNVGKSSLLNAICGEPRAIVSPIRGTTRDTIDTTIEREGRLWKLLDTAGIRRRRSVSYGPEYFGITRSFKAVERSDVCVLVIDALDGVTEQDQRVAGRIEEDGRACVIVVNKWDAIEKDSHTMTAMEKDLRAKLYFLDWAPMLFTSALNGQRVESIFSLAMLAVEQHRRRVTTSVVNEVLQEAVSWRSPPTSRGGRQGRIYYGTQVAVRPPSFTLFVNEPKLFGETYRRYVERQIRQGLGFDGSPIKLFWRGKQQRDAEKEQARQQARSATP
ncbi:ribosome biogenesis GTPase Der [Synechococcus sp. ATX 2A4]|uniref:ribosome biogenesis GTPase Der n=1 Tax=Synechococcus sp. ATX 2A4 TaxID=2823727 RepID=UPI0020CBFA70|nr:ribosome biogenesis GTPase Der [Synechococcus sp. ATX 2A4]MCP9885052.1 ribosome biogenesis GTPase Der [Synechococcus sp. ATX 2A4]